MAAWAEGLTGEGEQTWNVQKAGSYTLTHTTYTNGVAGKVESATFNVAGKDIALAQVGKHGILDGIASGGILELDERSLKIPPVRDHHLALPVRSGDTERAQVILAHGAPFDHYSFHGFTRGPGNDRERHRSLAPFLVKRGLRHTVACLEHEKGSGK